MLFLSKRLNDTDVFICALQRLQASKYYFFPYKVLKEKQSYKSCSQK